MQNYQEMMQDTFDNMIQIGEGGGGTVFKAHHRRLDKEVVLKKIHTSQLDHISHRAELDLLKNLKHNYIPQVLDFIEYGSEVFTVMEYIPGQSFAQLLEQGKRFARKDVVKWMRQLCEVVAYLHSQAPPIIHCDIKPANVMLTPAGDICLIDFNISGVKSEEGIASIGFTIGYAPVEQFSVVAGRLERLLSGQRGNTAAVAGNPVSGGAGGQTEILSPQGGIGAPVSQGAGETTVLLPQGQGGMGVPAGSGAGETMVLFPQGQNGMGAPVGQGEDRTMVLFPQGAGGAGLPAGQGEDRTMVLSDQGDDRTGILPVQGAALAVSPAAASAPAASPAPGGMLKSLMRNMSDEDWTGAKYVESFFGNNLMVDERTDIYSVGATVYHILTGVKPQPFFREQIPLRSIDDKISESLAYVIEKAMAVNPAERFRDSAQMLKVVRNMGIVDKRYKALARRQLVAAVLTASLTVASAFTVTLGRSTMAREKEEQYRTYIEEMETARAEQDYEKVFENYEKAVALDAGKADAYYETGMAYYEQRQYEQCIDFLSRNVYTNSAIEEENNYGSFYYMTGSCYFELEDYGAAVSYYEKAVEIQPEEIFYYRDYIIALARDGEMDEAERVLKQAREKGISADTLSLLNGEIALLQEKYGECEQHLKDCIADTEDDYVRLRAYSKLDDAYQLMYRDAEQCERRIEILSQALEALPASYQVTVIERLAQAYINYSDIGDRDACCEKAISLFDRMEEMGYATFTSRYNVAVLYEKMERYAEAQEQLDAMLETYPDNYNIYKFKAFVELKVQDGKAVADRDYHTFAEYYNQAQELYREKGGAEDMEMLSLQQLYGDVVANGWL